MQFISTGSPSARYYIDEKANAESVKFANGELETDDKRAIDALKKLAKNGAPIEVNADAPARVTRSRSTAKGATPETPAAEPKGAEDTVVADDAPQPPVAE